MLYSEKKKDVFTSKDLTKEHFNTMMAKQIEKESQDEPHRNCLGRTGDYSGGDPEYFDTTRSIGSSKSYSVRFSEDCSIASPDMSTTASRSGTSLGGNVNKSQQIPRTASVVSSMGRSSQERSSYDNITSSGMSSGQLSSIISKGNNTTFTSASRNTSEGGRITRSKSVGFGSKSSQSTLTSENSKKRTSERRAASALPNIGRQRERVNLPQRPKTSSSMYRYTFMETTHS